MNHLLCLLLFSQVLPNFANFLLQEHYVHLIPLEIYLITIQSVLCGKNRFIIS